jgi:hypothetical protein
VTFSPVRTTVRAREHLGQVWDERLVVVGMSDP